MAMTVAVATPTLVLLAAPGAPRDRTLLLLLPAVVEC